jgi:hypothetical protein
MIGSGKEKNGARSSLTPCILHIFYMYYLTILIYWSPGLIRGTGQKS